MTSPIPLTDLSYLAVGTALASLLLAWVLAGRHWRAPARIRKRRRPTPIGAFPLLLAAEFSGRYVELLRFAERQLLIPGGGAAPGTGRRAPDDASRRLIRRLRRLDREMRWSGSPWWPSLDLWRSAGDRRTLLQGRLESILHDVNVRAEAGRSRDG